MPAPTFGPRIFLNSSQQDSHFLPTVAAMADGRFVIAWYSLTGDDYKFSTFNGDGARRGVEQTIVTDASASRANRIEAAGTPTNELLIAYVDEASNDGDVMLFRDDYPTNQGYQTASFNAETINVSTGSSGIDPAGAEDSPYVFFDHAAGLIDVGFIDARGDNDGRVIARFSPDVRSATAARLAWAGPRGGRISMIRPRPGAGSRSDQPPRVD